MEFPLTDCDGRQYRKDGSTRTYAPKPPNPEAQRDARAAAFFVSVMGGA